MSARRKGFMTAWLGEEWKCRMLLWRVWGRRTMERWSERANERREIAIAVVLPVKGYTTGLYMEEM